MRAVPSHKGSFNPAEAEEGFSSLDIALQTSIFCKVSIQPKPKKGLVAVSAGK